MTISFCSLQPVWEAHYAAPALTPSEKGEMKEEDVGVGGKGNAEPGFDLFALDQPARVPHGKGRGEGKFRVGLLLRSRSFG